MTDSPPLAGMINMPDFKERWARLVAKEKAYTAGGPIVLRIGNLPTAWQFADVDELLEFVNLIEKEATDERRDEGRDVDERTERCGSAAGNGGA